MDVLWIVVLLNACATITLWQRAARRPAKLKKKFLNRFWNGKPITPKHEPPPPLKADTYGVRKEVLQFSSDFEDFAEVVNSWLADPHTYPHGKPWRLQEFPEPDLVALWGTSGAIYCRTYAVFHNQVRIGKIEIKPDWEYSTESPEVWAHVEFHWVRLLDFGTIRSFLIDIAMLVSKPRSKLEWLQTNQQIDLAMIGVLWETQEISRFGMDDGPSHGEIKVNFEGLASFYLDRREVWRKEVGSSQAARSSGSFKLRQQLLRLRLR